MTRTLKTWLMWHDSTGSEVECDVLVEYDTFNGFAGDMTDPPEDARIEIVGVTAVDKSISIPAHAIDEEVLADDCMQDWRDDEIDAAEYRAEHRAEQLRDERYAAARSAERKL
jgi:hypothetical protein